MSDSGDSPGFGPWRDPGRACRWAVGGVTLVLVITTVDVLWTGVGIVTVSGMVEGIGDAWFDAYDQVLAVLGTVYLLALVASGITFIRWQWTALGNLPFLGRERSEFSRAVAAIAWFIPVVSLVLPWLVVASLARDSRPPGARSATEVVGWWWGLWVAGNLAAGGAAVGFTLTETATGWIAAATADSIASLVVIASGVLALRVVTLVSEHQRRLADHRAAPGP